MWDNNNQELQELEKQHKSESSIVTNSIDDDNTNGNGNSNGNGNMIFEWFTQESFKTKQGRAV